MQRLNEFQLYTLATAIHPLTSASNEAKYSDVWFGWFGARENLQEIFKHRALEVCYQSANELYLAIDAVVPRAWEDAIKKLQELPDPEPTIGWEARVIRTAAEKFETVLSAELASSDTYWISPKGTHKTSVLMTSARRELPESIVKEVPEAAADFDEAGRCLLFDSATATGFHLLRATEAVIRKYYKLVTGIDPKTKFRNWRAYIKVLEQENANPKITSFLDHIRENYRNPILHPEQNLSLEEAQILFGVCVSAILMISEEMKMLAAKGSTPPFPCDTLAQAIGTP